MRAFLPRALPLALLLGCPETASDQPDSKTVLDSVADTGLAADTGDTGDSSTDSETEPPCDTSLDWYRDADGDRHGDPDFPTDCDDPAGAATDHTDCDDTRATVNPKAPELATSGRDDNCDGDGDDAPVTEIRVTGVTIWEEEFGVVKIGKGGTIASDVDGDGTDDLLVSDYLYDGATGHARGAILVYPGPLTAGGSEALHIEDASFRLIGGEGEGIAWVDPVGDLDGDGVEDLALSGMYGFQPGEGQGVVYVLKGPLDRADVQLTDEAQRYEGTGQTASQYAFAGVGDLSGDGLADLAIGADDGGGVSGGNGEVWLLHGPVNHASVAEAESILHGDNQEKLGDVVRAVGDLNGDGLPDLAVTTRLDWAYLVLDAPPGSSHPRETGVTFFTDVSGASIVAPPELSPVGDLNGDGALDLGITESGGDYVLLFLGPFGHEDTIDIRTSSPHAVLVADNDGWPTNAQQVRTLGDWDLDGHEDLVVANSWYIPEEKRHDHACSSSGENLCFDGAAYLLAGPVSSGWTDLDTAADILGPQWTDSEFGEFINTGGDVNDDGFPDLLVGQPDAASAFVIFGGGFD